MVKSILISLNLGDFHQSSLGIRMFCVCLLVKQQFHFSIVE